MLTHANFISNVVSITAGLPISSTDIALSVLPLSHIFGENRFLHLLLQQRISLLHSFLRSVGENLREVRPTIMTAVPRLFEKVYHRIVKKGFSQKGWRAYAFLFVHWKLGIATPSKRIKGDGLTPHWPFNKNWQIVWYFRSGVRELAGG